MLLNFSRGAFRSGDLGPAHRFLMENVFAVLWIYYEIIAAAAGGEHGLSDDGMNMTLVMIVLLEDYRVIMHEVAFWQTETTRRVDMLIYKKKLPCYVRYRIHPCIRHLKRDVQLNPLLGSLI